LNAAAAERFEAALVLYRSREWDKARIAFNAVLDIESGDKPSKIYLERCGYFMQNPPEEGWDGVFNRAEK
jgi:adenylate cyclase